MATAIAGTGLFGALALAVLDLYLTGHGHSSIRTEILSLPHLGVHLSVADLVLLGAVALAGGIAWRATRGIV